jgi:ribosome-associated protein
MIKIDDKTYLDEQDLQFTASRSAGPGGQNVNKVETRITLRFDLEHNTTLSPEQKGLIRDRLATRLSKAGIISVSSQKMRSQLANRDAALDRLLELLQDALEIPAARRPSRPPLGAKRRRLENKRERSALKRTRRAPAADD